MRTLARSGRTDIRFPRKGPGRERSAQPGVRWQHWPAQGAARDRDELAGYVSAYANASSCDHNGHSHTCSCPTSKRSLDHLHCWRQARRSRDCNRPDAAPSIMFDHLHHSDRHTLNRARIISQNCGLQRYGFVDLEYRLLNSTGHRNRDGRLQRLEQQQSHTDRVKQRHLA